MKTRLSFKAKNLQNKEKSDFSKQLPIHFLVFFKVFINGVKFSQWKFSYLLLDPQTSEVANHPHGRKSLTTWDSIEQIKHTSKHEAKGHCLVLMFTRPYENFRIGIIDSVTKATLISLSKIKPFAMWEAQSNMTEPCTVPGTPISLN